jgi:hypothetical protein
MTETPKKQIFRFNPGAQEKVFPPKHPYYKTPEMVKTVINEMIKQKSDYTVVKTFKNGGTYSEHAALDKTLPDYKLVKNVGIEFAKNGKQVKALPRVHVKSEEYKTIFGALEGTKYFKKCPDMLIGGEFYEVESFTPPFKAKKIGNMISKGLKQSENIVINNNSEASDRYINRIIYDHIKHDNQVNEVWLYENGKIRLLYKKQ